MSRITEKQKDNVVRLYQKTDLKTYEIADLCNLSTGSVSVILRERNIPAKRSGKADADSVDKAISMYEQGYAIRFIIKRCKVPQSQLYAEIKERGITKRKGPCTRVKGAKPETPIEQIVKEYQKGKSYAEIGRELQVSFNTVKKYVMQAIDDGEIDISDRYAKDTDILIKQIAELVAQSKEKPCIREVAKAFKVDEKKIAYQLRRMKK